MSNSRKYINKKRRMIEKSKKNKNSSTISSFDVKMFCLVSIVFVTSIVNFTGTEAIVQARNKIIEVVNSREVSEAVTTIGEMVSGVSEEAVQTVFAMFEEELLDEEGKFEQTDEIEEVIEQEEEFVPVFLSESAVPEELLHPEMLDFGQENDKNEANELDAVSEDKYKAEFTYVTPTNGTVTSAFGNRIHPVSFEKSFHYGIDIANVTGTQINSFADGIIEHTGYSNSYGNYLIIDHGNEFKTLYAHCDKISVSSGDEITIGEKVAEMGSTGVSTGSHLHFEVRINGKIIDPTPYLNL